MIYRMYGDTVQLIKYIIKLFDNEEEVELHVISDKEKNAILNTHPGAVIEEVDNDGYEWLNGMSFSQEQLLNGELERAVELGESGYKEYLMAIDPDAQLVELDYRLSLLELGIVGGE